MRRDQKPWWKQATALVTVGTGGAITGFTFVPGEEAAITAPSSIPVHLLALEQAAQSAGSLNARAVGGDNATSASADALLRLATVNVAKYYLGLAKTRTPAQMEALIWDNTSVNEADHGPSCAAFASLTLELAAQTVGQRSWVTGGTSYPWPMPAWADVRVDENPASPQIISMVQDATAHSRWHPEGDGYQPQPGDWVLFSQHVEVVTSYEHGVLDTIGANSEPHLTVNAHSFSGNLAADGVQGFIDNGQLANSSPAGSTTPPAKTPASAPASAPSAKPAKAATIPGVITPPTVSSGGAPNSKAMPAPSAKPASSASGATARKSSAGNIPGVITPGTIPTAAADKGTSAPGATPAAVTPTPTATPSGVPSQRNTAPASATTPGTAAQQAFINLVAPGAIAGQRRYGVPAAVTIAQAIDESGWGQSQLATQYHNLFGMKGTGPAGSVTLPTEEYENGQWVRIEAKFRVYHNAAESIADHDALLATSGYYTQAMADRAVPDAFANDLTGIYATDPDYGANLIALMKLYNLYRFDTPATVTAPATPTHTPTPAATPTPTPAPTSAPAATPTSATPAAGKPIPGVAVPALAPTAPAAKITPVTGGAAASSGSGSVPGVVAPQTRPTATAVSAANTAARPAARAATASRTASRAVLAARYEPELPPKVATAFFASAKGPLAHGAPLYKEAAGRAGIRWEFLAACDWMQCKADPRYSPVQGERLGTLNTDGTSFRTRSAALAQCAADLVTAADAIYGIDLTAPAPLSVRSLAEVFAAFRWGAVLQRKGVSAMEFPYSVAGLTAAHLKMHWPDIDAPQAPDRPGARFREPFGAVPVVLSLGYPATV